MSIHFLKKKKDSPEGKKTTEQKLYYPKDLWEFIKSIAPTLIFIGIIRCMVFEPFKIPSGSMIPTLLVGDHLVSVKFMYGISRYSFFFGSMFNYFNGRKFQIRKPKRGDVIVFALPSNPKITYIKRCVGLPGDTVQLQDGYLHINGSKLPLEKSQEKYTAHDGDEFVSGTVYTQTLPGGIKHDILKQHKFGESSSDNTSVYTVPEGHYFMMGDNRDGSSDSRFMDGLGFVPYEYFLGPAEIIFFSIDEGFALFQPWAWPLHIRYKRLLNVL